MTTAALASASAVPVGPTLASIQMQTWIYAEPRRGSAKLGYLRAGAIVARKEQPSGKEGCADGWYAVQPVGYVCIGEQATLDSNHPIVRVTSHRRPDLLMPMPYRYGFIRSVAPQYLKVPTDTEQHDHEFKLDNHLKYYAKHATEWQIVDPGANDVPPEQRGKPVTVAPKRLGSEAKSKEIEKVSKDDDDNGGGETVDFGDAGLTGGSPGMAGAAGAAGGKTSVQLSLLELFGADSGDETIPWWLQGPERQVPQLSSFVAPKYAVIAGRVKRHTGLAFIDAFHVGPAFGDRDMAVTTDLRLVPISKLKPNVGSQWHGVDLEGDFTLPIAFAHDFSKDGKGQIVPKSTPLYAIDGDAVKPAGSLVFRQAVALSGKDRTVDGTRYFETRDGKWLKKGDIIIARKPDEWPKDFAKGSQRWIDLSVLKQTLVLYEGDKPVFATLVSTGQDGIGDPDTTKSTVRGTFRIREKHVTTTMDANEVENKFELRDVPWVQYFEKGYAMHAAYWHDEYGSPRSHGCVNLSPIDARRVFFWTGPELPVGWHAAYSNELTDKGTIVYSHI
ncbi:MAG: hypothetical protein NVS3B10_09920 [Polyangiales bacterium]